MSLLHIVIIWILGVLLGGCIITCIVLWVTRDTGQHSAGWRLGRPERRAELDVWRACRDAVLGLRAADEILAPRCRHGYLALADGTCAEDRVRAELREQPPAAGNEAITRFTQAMIEASIRRIYAQAEKDQTRQLALTAWSSWR